MISLQPQPEPIGRTRGRWRISPLGRMIDHVEALGLGHRPDPNDAGRHFSTCPVCRRADALVIFEPDDHEPVRVWCRARCHRERLEEALAVTPVATPVDVATMRDPDLLRRQGALLLMAADWLERNEAPRLRAVA
jgi:hypothetical protein